MIEKRRRRKGVKIEFKHEVNENFSRAETLRFRLLVLRQLIRESEIHTEALKLRAEEIRAEREELLKE